MADESSGFQQLMTQVSQEHVDKALVEAAIHGIEPDALGLAYSLMLDEDRYKYIQPAFEWAEVATLLQVYFKKCIVEDFESDWADSRTTAMFDCQNWLRATWDDSEEDIRQSWRRWLKDIAELDGDISVRLSSVIHGAFPVG